MDKFTSRFLSSIFELDLACLLD